jgi:hypothetical protein
MTAVEHIEKTRESARLLVEASHPGEGVKAAALNCLGMCALAHALLEASPTINLELAPKLLEEFKTSRPD